MSQPAERTFALNEIVGHIARPGRWQIVKINRVTIEIKGLDGQQPARVKAQRYSLTDAPEQTPAGESVTVDIPVYFAPGEIVTSFVPKIAGRLLVVERDDGGPKVRTLELYGENGWHVPRATLSAVTPSELVRVMLMRAYPLAVGGDEQSAISLVRQMLDDSSAEYDRAMKANSA